MDYAALAKQYGGTPSAQTAKPAQSSAPAASGVDYSVLAQNMGGKAVAAPSTPAQKPVGFVQGLVRAVASPFLRAGANVASLADLGDPAALAKDQSQGVSYGDYLGSYRPIGSPLDANGKPVSGGKMLADTLGTGVEAASYVTGAGEASDAAIAAKDALVGTGEVAAKQTVKQALIQGAKTGAVAGALQGGGNAAQAQDATVGSVLGSTALGGLAGGVLGAGVEAAAPAIGAAKSKAGDIISSLTPEGRAATNATKAENLVGVIAQGSKDDIPAVTNSLKQIDMTGVKTYQDAANRVNEHIASVAGSLDQALETNPYQKVTSELGHTTSVGGQSVTHNYVDDAMSQLRNYYEKTNNVEGTAAIDQLAKKGATEGLTVKDVNDLARAHGRDLNGYNANGELASGLTKQAAENTRQGLKATARAEFNHPIYEQSDKVMSDLIKTKGLFQDMADKAQAAQQKIKSASLPQKVGSLLENALNIGTLGTSRGALKAAGTAMGIKGGETLSTLELQKALQANIAKLDSILGTDSKGEIMSKIQSYLSGAEDSAPSAAKTSLPKPSKQGGYVSLKTLAGAGALAGAATIGATAASTPSTITYQNPSFKQATTQIDPAARNQIAATVFGELSNKGDQAAEARKILSTMVNRTKQNGETIQQVISAPNQYQAYGGSQYKEAMGGNLDAPSAAKMAIVQKAVDDLYSGKLTDTTNGAVFYSHDKDGNLIIKPGKLKK